MDLSTSLHILNFFIILYKLTNAYESPGSFELNVALDTVDHLDLFACLHNSFGISGILRVVLNILALCGFSNQAQSSFVFTPGLFN